MATDNGHTRSILASKVQGMDVYDADGDNIGQVEDVVLDKLTNNIMFAVLGVGGVLGVGEKYHPVPWSMLDYDPEMGGYVVRLSKDELEQAPAYDLDELTRNDSHVRTEAFGYYHAPQYW